MIRPVVRDMFFLGQKSEPATKPDLPFGQDKCVWLEKYGISSLCVVFYPVIRAYSANGKEVDFWTRRRSEAF